jgi:hypothetical protein
MTYAAVLDLEQENWDHYHALPEYFRLDKHYHIGDRTEKLLGWGQGNTQWWDPAQIYKQQLQWQRLFLEITLHNRIMRLHRPYLTRAYTDHRFKASRGATLHSARKLLRLAEDGQKIGFPGLKWWVVLVHIFTAAVALCIDIHFTDAGRDVRHGPLPGNEAENAQLIDLAINVLDTASLRSKAAKRAVHIIRALYEQARLPQDTIQERKRKRQREADDHSNLSQYPSHHDSRQARRKQGDHPMYASVSPAQTVDSDSSVTISKGFEEWLGSDWSSLLNIDNSARFAPASSDVLAADLLQAINAFASSNDGNNLP